MATHTKLQLFDDYAILSFKELQNLDANVALRVKAEVKGLLDDVNKDLIISLNGIEFIDSTGFGSLISILKLIKNKDKKLALCMVSNEVKELMDLMQLNSIFKVYADVNLAAASFK